MPRRELTITEFARRLEKARKVEKSPNNPFGIRGTEAIPPAARGFGLIRRRRKRILRPEVI